MDPRYALFIWASYGLSALVVVWNLWSPRRTRKALSGAAAARAVFLAMQIDQHLFHQDGAFVIERLAQVGQAKGFVGFLVTGDRDHGHERTPFSNGEMKNGFKRLDLNRNRFNRFR